MTDHYRVVRLLLAAPLFLPNVVSGRNPSPSCDAKAPMTVGAKRLATAPKRASDAPTTADDRLAALAASAPGGFAGAYREASAKPGKLVVRLTRLKERGAALKAILPKLRELDGADVDRGGVLVVPARWDFAQLMDWRHFLEQHANAVAKVVSTEIDRQHNRISYRVASRADRDALLKHLGTLNIPCGLVAVEVS